METKDLIRILGGLPETRLRLLELTPKLLNEQGELIPDKATFYVNELIEATKEVEQYSNDTRRAVACLKRLARLWT